jgi:hypothetical protein
MTVNDPDLYPLFLGFGLVVAVFIVAWMAYNILDDHR